jgi:prevent-host-death family protein
MTTSFLRFFGFSGDCDMAVAKTKPRIKVMNTEDVRRGLSGVLSDVAAGQDVVIERHSKKVGIVISYEAYEAIQEKARRPTRCASR